MKTTQSAAMTSVGVGHDACLLRNHVSELLQGVPGARVIVWQQRHRARHKALGLSNPKPVLADLIDQPVGMKAAAPSYDKLR